MTVKPNYVVGSLIRVNSIHPFIQQYLVEAELGKVIKSPDYSHPDSVDRVDFTVLKVYDKEDADFMIECEVEHDTSITPVTIQSYDVEHMANNSISYELLEKKIYTSNPNYREIRRIKIEQRKEQLAYLIGEPIMVPLQQVHLERNKTTPKLPTI